MQKKPYKIIMASYRLKSLKNRDSGKCLSVAGVDKIKPPKSLSVAGIGGIKPPRKQTIIIVEKNNSISVMTNKLSSRTLGKGVEIYND